MPIPLGEKYLPAWNGYPPHMSSEDQEIWKRYKPYVWSIAVNFYYDVGLGGQENAPEGTSPEMAKMYLRTTQKRADVLIETDTGWIIIELRKDATGAALGRLLMYRDLWLKERPDERPLRIQLVTDR